MLVPALLLTLGLDAAGRHGWPALYRNPAIFPADHVPFRLLVNLLSLQGIWGRRISFGSNPALWSVGYEFCFYVVFGLFAWRAELFKRGWKAWALIAAVLLFAGPKITAYLGLWALGGLTYRRASRRPLRCPLWAAACLACAVLGAEYLLEYRHPPHVSEFAADFLFGAAVCALLLVEVELPAWALRCSRPNTFMADFSFSVYAYHLPLLFLACAAASTSALARWPQPRLAAALAAAALVACRALYYVTERQRPQLRALAARALPRRNPL